MILGVDPGLASCGWAVVDPRTKRVVELGVITTEHDSTIAKSTDRARRMAVVARGLHELVQTYAVRTVAAEAMLLFGNVAAATAQSLCWGTLIAVAERHGCEILEVVARDWQRAVLPGEGRIKYEGVKDKLAKFVGARVLRFPKDLQTHALDAVGVAVYASLRSTRRVAARAEAGAVHA